MINKFKVAVCQMQVVEDKHENVDHALEMVKIAAKKAELIVLPEMFNCPYDTKKFPEYAEKIGESTTLNSVANAAKKYQIYILAGSIPENYENKIFNTSCLFNPQGKLLGLQRKLHLFDINVPGKIFFRESDTLTPGDAINIIDTPLSRIGVVICYDIRFPEFSRLLTLKGAQLILMPGAFNLTTGPAHWHSLIRARAIDNQVYFVAASPARDYKSSYTAYGHSMIVDPWGDILAQAGEGEEIIYAPVDLDYLMEIRQNLPLLSNRRTDIYDLIEKNSE